ncbi:MAG: 4Fe-4S binding protein, partial [Candidatus Bathyarchaeia archaeon]
AIGQIAETNLLPREILIERNGDLQVNYDPVTLATNIPGVFVGGDLATGPASIIEAVAAGKRAAESIHLYLRGMDMLRDRESQITEVTWVKNWNLLEKKDRRYYPPVEKPHMSFEEAIEYLEQLKGRARFEAFRCLECGPCAECLANLDLCEGDKAVVNEGKCVGCNVCAVVCPFGAIKKNSRRVAQVDEDLCKGCGICASRCPERAIEMKKLTDDEILKVVVKSLMEAAE